MTGCFAAGAYRSLKRLKDGEVDFELVVYWCVLGLLQLFTLYLEWLVSWFPFYYSLKSAALVILMVPRLRLPRIAFHTIVIPGITYAHGRLSEELPRGLALLHAVPLIILDLFIPGINRNNSGNEGGGGEGSGSSLADDGDGSGDAPAGASVIRAPGEDPAAFERRSLKERARSNRTMRDLAELGRRHHIAEYSPRPSPAAGPQDPDGGSGGGGMEPLDLDGIGAMPVDGGDGGGGGDDDSNDGVGMRRSSLQGRIEAQRTKAAAAGRALPLPPPPCASAPSSALPPRTPPRQRSGGGRASASTPPSRGTSFFGGVVRSILTGSKDLSVRDHFFDLTKPPPAFHPDQEGTAAAGAAASPPGLRTGKGGSGEKPVPRSRSTLGRPQRLPPGKPQAKAGGGKGGKGLPRSQSEAPSASRLPPAFANAHARLAFTSSQTPPKIRAAAAAAVTSTPGSALPPRAAPRAQAKSSSDPDLLPVPGRISRRGSAEELRHRPLASKPSFDGAGGGEEREEGRLHGDRAERSTAARAARAGKAKGEAAGGSEAKGGDAKGSGSKDPDAKAGLGVRQRVSRSALSRSSERKSSDRRI